MPTPTLNQILDNARLQTDRYVEVFKNLTAIEKKSFEIYGKDESVKKTRTIESRFLVYQPTDENASAAEYRSVTAVDGKAMDNVDKRTQEFFLKVLKAGSSDKELDQILKESTRHDPEFSISEFTLFEALALDADLRGKFDFELGGMSDIDGHRVYVVRYKQISDSPQIVINGDDRSAVRGVQQYSVVIQGGDKDRPSGRFTGTMYLDADTFRLRRESRTLWVVLGDSSTPYKAFDQQFDYQDSQFDILTPKRVSHLQYRIDLKEGRSKKDISVVFDYSDFSRPDVEVTSSDVNNKN